MHEAVFFLADHPGLPWTVFYSLVSGQFQRSDTTSSPAAGGCVAHSQPALLRSLTLCPPERHRNREVPGATECLLMFPAHGYALLMLTCCTSLSIDDEGRREQWLTSIETLELANLNLLQITYCTALTAGRGGMPIGIWLPTVEYGTQVSR